MIPHTSRSHARGGPPDGVRSARTARLPAIGVPSVSTITADNTRYTTGRTITVNQHTCSTFRITGKRYACGHGFSVVIRRGGEPR